MSNEVSPLIELLRKVYYGPAWHGPSIMEVLKEITAIQSVARINNTHTIAELVEHMISWRDYVIEMLTGNANYTVSDIKNFPTPRPWPEILQALEEQQQRLIKTLGQFPHADLKKKVGNNDFDYYTLLHGIIHHDLYHIGQIQLIKKAE